MVTDTTMRLMERVDRLRQRVEGLAPHQQVALQREEAVEVIALVLALADQARDR